MMTLGEKKKIRDTFSNISFGVTKKKKAESLKIRVKGFLMELYDLSCKSHINSLTLYPQEFMQEY